MSTQRDPKPVPGLSPRISACIVSYNTIGPLERCLRTLEEFVVPLGVEVIVVDNGSIDGSAVMVEREFPAVRLIHNAENRYFTGGVNQAARAAQGEYLLFVNSDGYFVDASVERLVAFLESHPECGAAEGLTLSAASGVPSRTARRYCSLVGEVARFGFLGRPLRRLRFYRGLRYMDRDQTGTWEVEVACNCFMLMRRSAFERMGGADESMLLYFSEDDWSRTLQSHGLVRYHVGSARMFHIGEASSAKLPSARIEAMYYHDRYAYFRKHNGLASAVLTNSLIFVRRNALRGFQVLREWRRLPSRVPALASHTVPGTGCRVSNSS